MTKSENVNLVLGREEAYKASPRIWSFKYTDDIVNGLNLNLSNMVSAYPFNAHIHIFGKPLQIS